MLLPSTELQLPALRLYASATSGAIGTALATVNVTGTQFGGFFTQPIQTPVDFDRSREARLFLLIASNTAAQPAGNVRLDTVFTWCDDASAPLDQLNFQVVAIPLNYPVGRSLQVEIGSAAAPFLPGGILTPNSSFGLRVARSGSHGTDTWTGTLAIAMTARLRYHRLCQFCDGCT